MKIILIVLSIIFLQTQLVVGQTTTQELVAPVEDSAVATQPYSEPVTAPEPESTYATKTMNVGKPANDSEGGRSDDCKGDAKGRCLSSPQQGSTIVSGQGVLKPGPAPEGQKPADASTAKSNR